jgi:methionyl-tRNA formyltransferase
MVVAAYGLILPQWVLDLPRLGCFNIHASLLPRWRGAAPIHRAIEAGDSHTGISIMQMDAGLDTGDMLLVQSLPILPTDSTGALHDRLAALGGELMVQALSLAAQGSLRPVQQPLQGISYASKIDKSEAAIDWTQSAQTICQRIRAFNPFPGASTQLNGEVLKIWAAEVSPNAAPPASQCGQIVGLSPSAIEVAATDSVLTITELQRPGGKRLGVADFLRGNPVQVGQVLGG